MATKWKSLLFGMVLGIALFGSLFFNIVAHETGHWIAAEAFNLDPKIHLFEPFTGGKSSLFTPNFFTTYNSAAPESADAGIAFAGPLVNLIITLGLTAAYFAIPKEKRTFKLALLFIVLIVPSLISFIANMLPLPATDGSLIWNFLK